MNLRDVRLGIVTGVALLLIFFFLPVVPFTLVVVPACGAPGPYGVTSCSAIPAGGSNFGYKSIGNAVSGWGAQSSSWYADSQDSIGYVTPSISFGSNTLTGYGFELAILIPVVLACLWLLAPEILSASRFSRAGFIALGVSLFALSMLLFNALAQQPEAPREMLFVASFYLVLGVPMSAFGLYHWASSRLYE